MKNRENTTKQLHLELLRCLAILLVVLVHVTSEPLSRYRDSLGTFFHPYVWGFTIGHLGVPLFLMISGALLLDPHREISLRKLYGRMIPRILIPLVFWGYCFSLIKQWFSTRSFQTAMLKKAWMDVLKGKSWTHLWYLYMLIGLYLLLPVLRSLVRALKESEKLYLVSVLLFLGSVLPTLDHILKLKISLQQPKPLCYVTMFLMGYFLTDYAAELTEKGQSFLKDRFSRCIFTAGSLSLTVLTVYSFMVSAEKKKAYLKLARYSDLFIILTAACLFYLICVCRVSVRRPMVRKWIYSLGECSFGIYLLHPVVLNFVYKELSLHPGVLHPCISLILFWLPLVTGCHVMVWAMRHIPVVRKLV